MDPIENDLVSFATLLQKTGMALKLHFVENETAAIFLQTD